MEETLAFTQWLDEERKSRGWTRAKLARNAKVSATAISDVLNGKRNAGRDLCTAIADAFNYPPDYVFRKAGLLPDVDYADPPGLDDLVTIYRGASSDVQEEILEFARFKTRW